MRPNWFIGLACTAEDLPGSGPPPPRGLRILHPSDRHLTVAFLGGVEPEAARASFAALPPLRGPIEVTLGEAMGLGHPRRWTALTLGLAQGREEVTELMEGARGALWSAAGARPDTRPALPHMTLGRLRVRAKPQERQRALDWAAELSRGGVRILDTWALYTWSDWRVRRQPAPRADQRVDFRRVDERSL